MIGCVVDRDIGPEDLISKEDPPVTGQGTPDTNHFVRDNGLGFIESRSFLVEEDRDISCRVFEFGHAVAVCGGPYIHHDAEYGTVLLSVPAGFVQSLDRDRVTAVPDQGAQPVVPVTEILGIVLDARDTPGTSGNAPDNLARTV